MAKFFFTPAICQNVAMVTNSGVIAVPSTRNDNLRYSLSHLNAVVTPEIYIVYVAEVSNIPQLVFVGYLSASFRYVKCTFLFWHFQWEHTTRTIYTTKCHRILHKYTKKQDAWDASPTVKYACLACVYVENQLKRSKMELKNTSCANGS